MLQTARGHIWEKTAEQTGEVGGGGHDWVWFKVWYKVWVIDCKEICVDVEASSCVGIFRDVAGRKQAFIESSS